MTSILLATTAVVVIYNLLFFHIGFGIGTALLVLILNFYYFFLRDRQNSHNLPLALTSSVLSILFALLIGFRDSGLVLVINLLSSIFFLLTAIYFYQDKNAFHYSVPHFLLTPLSLLGNMLDTLFGVKPPRDEITEPKDHSTTKAILKGFAITLPIFVILLILLTQADPIFQKFTGDILQNIGERVVVSAIVFISLFVFALTKIKEKVLKEESVKTFKKEKAYEIVVLLGSLVVLFTAFIAVQFQYLFTNLDEKHLAQLGIASLTYSEYVRKGFAELIMVSVVAISVLIYVMQYLHGLAGNQKLTLQILASVFTLETGLMILSAAQRDILYADAHGLTRARVYGFIFLIWLAVFLILMLVKVLINLDKRVLFNLVLGITILSLLSFSAINIDGKIATEYKPTVNNEIDYYYLTSISSDAYQSWKPAIEEIDHLLNSLPASEPVSSDNHRKLLWARYTLDNIEWHKVQLEDKYASSEVVMKRYEGKIPDWVKEKRNWQSFNLSQKQAYDYLLENQALFSQIPALKERITKAQNGPPPAIPLDRELNAPFTQNR